MNRGEEEEVATEVKRGITRKNRKIIKSWQEWRACGCCGLPNPLNLKKQNLQEPWCSSGIWELKDIWWNLVYDNYKSLLCSAQQCVYPMELFC